MKHKASRDCWCDPLVIENDPKTGEPFPNGAVVMHFERKGEIQNAAQRRSSESSQGDAKTIRQKERHPHLLGHGQQKRKTGSVS